MKITRVEPILLTVDMPERYPLRWSGGEAASINCALVRVHTDEGVTGLGDCYGSGFVAGEATAELFRLFGMFLQGKDPCDVAGCYETMYRRILYWGRSGLAVAAASAVENALWDIAGKAVDQPTCRLLGGLCHEKLPVYASGGLEQPLADLKAEMKAHLARGFKAVKMRIGVNLRHDLKRVAACREVLGPDVKLMADAVMGHNPAPWSAAEAIRVAKALEPYDLFWLEEPCFAADYDGYAHVRRSTSIPISGGESACMRYEFKTLLRPPGARYRPAGRLPGGRHPGMPEDRGHGRCLRRQSRPPCLGDLHHRRCQPGVGIRHAQYCPGRVSHLALPSHGRTLYRKTSNRSGLYLSPHNARTGCRPVRRTRRKIPLSAGCSQAEHAADNGMIPG